LELNTKVDIKGEKGKPLIESPLASMTLVAPPPNVLGQKYE
jgi:hypothetical protein